MTRTSRTLTHKRLCGRVFSLLSGVYPGGVTLDVSSSQKLPERLVMCVFNLLPFTSYGKQKKYTWNLLHFSYCKSIAVILKD